MNHIYICVVAVIFSMVVVITWLFSGEKYRAEDLTKGKALKKSGEKPKAESEKKPAGYGTENYAQPDDPGQHIDYIPNPLPLPKRRQRTEQMDYDVIVDDDDDYDYH